MLIEEVVHNEISEGVKDWIAQAFLAASLLSSPQAAAQQKSKTSLALTKQAPLKDLMAMTAQTPAEREQLLKKIALTSGIRGNELAALMAQASHETGGFKFLREIGDAKQFNKYESGRKAKILGNTELGDGTRFRGGGFLHITGRYNYRWIGKILGIDLEKNPALIEKPGIAAAASLVYWQDRVKPKVKDFKNIEKVTKQINPALKHASRRKAEFKKYSKTLPKTK